MQRTIKAIQKTYAVQAMLGLLGVLVGAVVGVLDVGFERTFEAGTVDVLLEV